MEMPMVRYAFVGVAWLFAASAWAQQASPTSETSAPATAKAVAPMEEPRQGDYWTYEVQDEITGKKAATRENVVTDVTPTDISVRFKIVGTPNEGFNIYDRSWNLISNSPWKYSPNDGMGIKAPLMVGKTWTLHSNDTNTGAGAVWNRSGNSKVVAQESVTTRAGTFETFKIETAYSSRNVADPTRKEDVTSVTWYAPAIDHWVKRTFISRVDKHLRVSNTIELVEYGRKK
jgi:hypothetical protein